MEIEEEDICRSCGQLLEVEHLVITECGDILCNGCMGFHDCDICSSGHVSTDSDYTPTEESSGSEEEEESEEED
jgi:hypothetical protein